MPSLDTAVIVLAGIALFAAFINGALGYGFSSLTVPLALVFYTNRVLNPAVVLVEVVTNFYVLCINLKGVAAVWKRVLPIITGLLPGIGIGAWVLTSVEPGWIKLGTYTLILPLILVQAAGWRRPIRSTWLVGLPFGAALGVLYSVTTISGPPLAILFNNQGLVKTEFRAGLALVRVAESSVTAIVYYKLGLFTAESGSLLWVFVPCVAVGVPLGAYVIRHLDAETFRRICMSFDAWVVGFGFSRVLIELNLMESPWAYVVLAVTILIDAYLLYLFFTRRAAARPWQTSITPGVRSGPDNRIASNVTEPLHDPFAAFNTSLGYVVAILAIAMLLFAPEVPRTEPQTDARPTKRPRHPNSLKNLKRDAGPGRHHGGKNKFSKEAVARFVDQYRADLAADWSKHGAAFVEKCRELYPQVYATMQRMRLDDELSRVQSDAGAITISWAATESAPPESVSREPPKQLTYKAPELPGDLTPADWQKLLAILEVVKRVAPGDAAPAEVLETVRSALLAKYAAE
jgi:uncharacterized membrane protein YfcA